MRNFQLIGITLAFAGGGCLSELDQGASEDDVRCARGNNPHCPKPDLAPPPGDRAIARYLPMPADMGTTADLAKPPADMATAPDLAKPPADMAMAPDLAKPPVDMAQAPDLARPPVDMAQPP